MASFKRAEIREILGEAYTDDIAAKLVELHRGVVDPLKDELDVAKRDATKYKTEAEKVPGLQKDLDEAKKGENWKAKYEKADQDLKDYKAKVAQDAETAKVKAAYKKLLTEEKISEKSLDAVLNVTDDIDTRWGGFKVQTRQRGEKVDTPPAGNNGGGDNSVREMTAKWHAERFGAAPKET